MYLKAKNIKAIEKQKNANILVVENRYEKMGESLYRINNDATNIILWLDGNHTFDEIAKKMCDNNTSLIEEAKINLNEFLNSLILNYGIVIDRLENPRYDEIRVLGNGKTQYPSAISIEITHTCNVKCLHCYGEYSCYNKFKDNTESIFKVLEDARRSGTRVVEFTGGEVTCHPRFLDILDKAYSLNYHLVSILSNGTNWNEDLFNEIYKNRDKTVVQIDLHGDNDDYINWFMGSKIKNISNIIKSNIVRIHKMGIYMRIVTMITPNNIDQLENIADWIHENGIETYGLSSIIPMGRATLKDNNNLLLKTKEDSEKLNEVISKINNKYGYGFLYQVKDGDSNVKNCGAFTRNPSITPEGDIKFCAMDDQTLIKSFGNVFDTDIGKLYTENYKILDLIRNIEAPSYVNSECENCEKKFFCSECIIRGLIGAKEIGVENCAWFNNKLNDEFRRLLI